MVLGVYEFDRKNSDVMLLRCCTSRLALSEMRSMIPLELQIEPQPYQVFLTRVPVTKHRTVWKLAAWGWSTCQLLQP